MSAMSVASAEAPSNRQRLFNRYFSAILLDMAVLGLFAEHWRHVTVDSFTIILLAAVLLQVLLKATIALEHRVGDYFSSRPGAAMKFARLFVAWLILFSSKFVILGAITLAFRGQVVFGGPLHGVVAFIAVVTVMLAAEELIVRFYRRLG